MGDVLMEEEIQIISYYLELTAGEGEDSEHGEKGGEGSNEFTQHTQLMVNEFF